MSKNKYDYLKSLSDFELVNIFNRETSHNGWTSERSFYLAALSEALQFKNISLERIIQKEENGRTSLSLRFPVFLKEENSKKTLEPIMQIWQTSQH